ncbi:glycosyltransferase family 2 protein [Saccharicrinis sp. FJH62]|uniref:glycosyltransferase family 2 protein n=1 Tax=Saccharicrinis sp. FJH62 TaxID=3344657 RepID=UPI0035D4DDD0
MISVVIPLYNKAHTITRTLGSVLKQSYSDFEVIIIDDGSTDNGVEVIKEYTDDARVKIHSQNNKGVSAARNLGVDMAIHDYIAFLDGDDEWLPDYLLKMSETIHKFPEAGMICCAGIVKDNQGEHLRLADKYQSQQTAIDYFENPHVFTHTSATIVRKDAFLKTSGFPVGMKRNQDFALFFSIGLQGKVAYCGIPLSVYVGEVEGQTTNTPVEKVIDHIINRFNYVQNESKKYPENPTYIIFTKYEIRHYILSFVRQQKYPILNTFINNLSDDIIAYFRAFELKIYQTEKLKYLAVFLLLIGKFRWRMKGYPRVK